jgi:hypothetical protein
MGKNNRPSSIDVLPDEVKSAIGKLRLQGRTIDEILAHLAQMDVEVSRSALGRHVQKLATIGERMKLSRDMATALVDRFGEEPDNRLARLNLEMMHSLVLDVMTAQKINETTGELDPVTLDAEQVMFLARSLQSLASAEKTATDRAFKVKAETKAEAAKVVEKVSREKGLTAETVAAIRSAVLGID